MHKNICGKRHFVEGQNTSKHKGKCMTVTVKAREARERSPAQSRSQKEECLMSSCGLVRQEVQSSNEGAVCWQGGQTARAEALTFL